MRRVLAVAIAACAVLAPGCMQPLLPVHEPEAPATAMEPPVFPWNVWIVSSHGCGFCGGELRSPEFHVTVLWSDGTVLTASYGPSGVPVPQVTYSEAASAWQAILDPLFAGTTLYGERFGGSARDGGIYVVEAKAARLGAADAKAVEAVVQRGLDQRRDPEPVGIVLDCGEKVVEVWDRGAPVDSAEVHCRYDEGGGWGRIAGQMYALRGWLR